MIKGCICQGDIMFLNISWFSTGVQRQDGGERIANVTNSVGPTGYSHANKQTHDDPYLEPYAKIYSQWITDLHVKPKLLEENTGENLRNLRLGKHIFDTMLTA